MSQLRVNDRVRLLHDIPDLLLQRGDEGVVTSVWFAPESAYEVEFERGGASFNVRKVLQFDQIEIAELQRPLHPPDVPHSSSAPGYTSRG